MVVKRIAARCILTSSVATCAWAAAASRDPSSIARHENAAARPPGTSPRGALPGSLAEERRYAAREAASPEAKQYRGGAVIVIGAGALVLILLIVLLIVLI